MHQADLRNTERCLILIALHPSKFVKVLRSIIGCLECCHRSFSISPFRQLRFSPGMSKVVPATTSCTAISLASWLFLYAALARKLSFVKRRTSQAHELLTCTPKHTNKTSKQERLQTPKSDLSDIWKSTITLMSTVKRLDQVPTWNLWLNLWTFNLFKTKHLLLSLSIALPKILQLSHARPMAQRVEGHDPFDLVDALSIFSGCFVGT